MNDLQLILTSTVTGTVVASLMTGGLAVIGQHLERGAKRKELLLKSAMDICRARIDRTVEMLKETGGKVVLQDDVMLISKYYQWLKYLDEKGKLPQEAIEADKQSAKELEEIEEQRRRNIRQETERMIRLSQDNPSYARSVLEQAHRLALTQEEIESLSRIVMEGYC